MPMPDARKRSPTATRPASLKPPATSRSGALFRYALAVVSSAVALALARAFHRPFVELSPFLLI
jgi:hypothetical protein